MLSTHIVCIPIQNSPHQLAGTPNLQENIQPGKLDQGRYVEKDGKHSAILLEHIKEFAHGAISVPNATILEDSKNIGQQNIPVNSPQFIAKVPLDSKGDIRSENIKIFIYNK